MLLNLKFSPKTFSNIATPARIPFIDTEFNRTVKKFIRDELLEYEKLYIRNFKEELLDAIERECIRVTSNSNPTYYDLRDFLGEVYGNGGLRAVNLLRMVAYLENYLGRTTALNFDRHNPKRTKS